MLTYPGPDATGRAVVAAPSETELRDYLAVFRRRWPVVVVASLAGLVLAGGIALRRAPTYTAKLLLETKPEESRSSLGIGSAVPLGLARPSEAVLAELEILRSRAVLEPVVDALALRAELEPPSVLRNNVASTVRVDAAAPEGTFSIRRQERQFSLVNYENNRVVSTADAGGALTGPGFELRLAEAPDIGTRVALKIVSRDDAVEALDGGLDTDPIVGTTMIRISFTHRDPRLAADVLNTLATSYQERDAARARESFRRRREYILSQLAEVSDTVQAAQALVTRRRQSAPGAVDLQFTQGETLERLQELESSVEAIDFQAASLASAITLLRTEDRVADGFRLILSLGPTVVPGGEQLYQRRSTLQQERRTLTAGRFGYTERIPRVEVIDSLIVTTTQDMIGVAEQSRRMLAARRENDLARLRALERQVRRIPGQGATIARLEGNLGTVEKVKDLLAERYYDAKISEAVEDGDVTVIDPALVPRLPNTRGTARILSLGLLVGLIFGTAGIFGAEYFDRRIRTAADLRRALGIKVLAVIPWLRSHGGEREGIASAPVREAFRMLRTSLLLHGAEPAAGRKVFAVTSPGTAEDKSFVAKNLAEAFATQGLKALLIDADLTRTAPQPALALPRDSGLVQVLSGAEDFGAAVRPLAAAGDNGGELAVLSAGTHDTGARELISAGAFEDVLARAKARYDFIVIDSPPIEVADGVLIAAAADGVVLVAQSGQTDRDAALDAMAQLQLAGTPVLGAVLNGFGGNGVVSRFWGSGDGERSARAETRSATLRRGLKGLLRHRAA